jgi:hypothetical protein
MQRKQRFPPEADTQPEVLRAKVLAARRSERAPKKADQRAEAPTEPPPAPVDRRSGQEESADSRPSGMRTRRGRSRTAATVDEVVADLSQDPRRERDEDE